jgi:DNA-binding transcriptional MocR family regulator
MALFRACLTEKICFAPGTMFSATDRYRHCLRLGVGGRWDDAQRRGLRRIGEIARLMLGQPAQPATALSSRRSAAPGAVPLSLSA